MDTCGSMLAGVVPLGGSQISSSGKTVLGAIEEIECFAPELELGALSEWNALGDAKIRLPQVWSANNVARSVAVTVREAAVIHRCKGRGVDPVHGRTKDRLSARWRERNSGNQVRALIGRVARGDGRA